MGFAGLALLVLAAFLAGVVNAIAGGGSLLTFPTLLGLGMPSIDANATSTVGLVPGSLAAAWGYRRELSASRRWLVPFVVASLAGGGAGALLLLATPERVFDRLVPGLILMATVLFALGGRVSRWLAPSSDSTGRARTIGMVAAQFLISVYGGYFGAGMGIMMLAVMSLLSIGDLHALNGLKSVCGVAINGTAAVLFLAGRRVALVPAACIVAGSVLGGLAGAAMAKRIGSGPVRVLVTLIGVAAAVKALLWA